MDRLSIVIQGALHPSGVEMIPLYSQYGDVIISTWKNADEELLQKASGLCEVVLNEVEDYSNQFNFLNVKRQAVSTMTGLMKVQTSHVIKVRCDETYETLTPIVKALKSPGKPYTCMDVFVRPYGLFSNHPSDHLIAGKTCVLKSTFGILLHMLQHPLDILQRHHLGLPSLMLRDVLAYEQKMKAEHGTRHGCPEVWIGDALFQALGIENTFDNFTKTYEIVQSHTLGFKNKRGLPHQHEVGIEINTIDSPESPWD